MKRIEWLFGYFGVEAIEVNCPLLFRKIDVLELNFFSF